MARGKCLIISVIYLCWLSKKSQVLIRLSKLFYTAMYRLLSRGQPLIWYHMYLYFIFQIIRFNKWFDVLLRYTLVRDRHSPPQLWSLENLRNTPTRACASSSSTGRRRYMWLWAWRAHLGPCDEYTRVAPVIISAHTHVTQWFSCIK